MTLGEQLRSEQILADAEAIYQQGLEVLQKCDITDCEACQGTGGIVYNGDPMEGAQRCPHCDGKGFVEVE